MTATPSSSIALLGAESCILFFMRFSLFFASRRYLLRNLYHDLQALSSDGKPLLSNVEQEVELDTLPTPTTATLRDDAQVLKGTFHATLSRLLFSLCFSETSTLFVLLICQGLDFFHARTRLLHWRLSLWLLLTMVLVLIPLAYSLILSYRSSSGKQTAMHRPSFLRMFLTALPVGLFLCLLSFVPLPAGLPTDDLWWNVLSRLTVVGTLILGLLSGFGAVSNAWKFFPSISRSSRKSTTDEDVQVAEEGLQRVRNDLATRRRSLERLELDLQPSDINTSWFSKVASGLRGGSQTINARQEISGLEALEYQMSRNLEALRSQRAEEVYSRTFTGRLINWVGRLFAIYCVYRIGMSSLNILLPSRPSSTSPTAEEPSEGRTDFLTTVLAHLLSLVPSIYLDTAGVALVSRQISLALVGVIILSSIRRVLRGVARALRVTSRRLGASLMLLMLAQVMGIYLLSTLVQLRTSFPPPPTRPDTEPDIGLVNLFSTLPEYQVFGSVFDSSFLFATGISAIVLWFHHRINSVGVVAT